MPRYADVDYIDLILEKNQSEAKFENRKQFAKGIREARRIIRNMSTADVVEVVKCKDCKYSREMDKYEKLLYLETCVGCTHHSTSYYSLIMQGDDYCSYGERKEEK